MNNIGSTGNHTLYLTNMKLRRKLINLCWLIKVVPAHFPVIK